jgi:hypothetical protein
MAILYPTCENIKRLKVQPTEGEMFLIKHFFKYLSDEIEIFFQPFIDGDRPDIILVQKNAGISIIEVKDWNLEAYYIDDKANWYLRKNNQKIKSPFRQVEAYKNNIFEFHINGLLEEKINNRKLYGKINTFVYFHKSTQYNLNNFLMSGSNNKTKKDLQYSSVGNDYITKIRLPKKIVYLLIKFMKNSKEFCNHLYISLNKVFSSNIQINKKV